ncbi:MAG: hypothetical protein AAF919_19220 [Pseudomonadota bacterium]
MTARLTTRAAILTSAALLSGCQAIGFGGAPEEVVPVSAASVDLDQALAVFQDVCVATYPSFAEFEAQATAAGLTERLRNGGFGSIDRSMAAVIRQQEDGPDGCFVNFFSTATDPEARGTYLATFDGAEMRGADVAAPVEGGEIVAFEGINTGGGNRFALRIQPVE